MQQVRIARPVGDLARTTDMYCRGIGLHLVDRFFDHDGFDGVILGACGPGYHFEFTRSREHPIRPRPTPEDLIVFYVPDEGEWLALCGRMQGAGFRQVLSFNPFWDERGRTYEDADGYRVVLQNAAWTGFRVVPLSPPRRPST